MTFLREWASLFGRACEYGFKSRGLIATALCLGTVASSVTPSSAAEFTYRGWEGFQIPIDEGVQGCRMSKSIQEDAHFIVQTDSDGSFLLGVYRKSWQLDPKMEIRGAISFDNDPPVPLNGFVPKAGIILLRSEANGLLRAAFKGSRILKMTFEGTSVQFDLTGSSRAVELLDQCTQLASRIAQQEQESEAAEAMVGASPAPSAVPAPELGELRQDMLYRDARRYLLEAGWQALYVLPDANDSPSDQEIRNEFGFPELASCSGTGMGFCAFGYKDAYGRELRLTTRGGTDFILHAWEVLEKTTSAQEENRIVFSGDQIVIGHNGEKVRLSERLPASELRIRFSGYNVQVTRGEDCLVCAFVGGPYGSFEIDYDESATTVTGISSEDANATDLHDKLSGGTQFATSE